ncbi:TraY domain-containing protein [Klebsiella pneumoniae]|uniref:type II toxin-antitoxin system RelB family antitoxin n=1 Tax=Klebsiella pneumoniae TaxID=573 RepID=UPI0022B6D437|nr:TraY domain-containing protein [Klebsiella pneumoniae]
MLAIRLSDEIESRLDSLAKQTGRTKTFYAREAILAHLEDPGGLLSFSRNCCTRSPW